MRSRRSKMVALTVGVVALGTAVARTSTSTGPVTQQSVATSSHRGEIANAWDEIVSLPLNCLDDATISADAGIQLHRRSGPARVRVVAFPFGEGDEFDPVVLDPGAVAITNETRRASSSGFPFVGDAPDGIHVVILGLQVRASGDREVVVTKATLRALWAAATPDCA